MAENATDTQLTVPEDLAGIRLTDFLERTWPDADRAYLRRLVRDGLVTLNFELAHGQKKLKPGDFVKVEFDDGRTAPPTHKTRRTETQDGDASTLEVLAEAAFGLVVMKPAGLPCVPDRAGRTPGVHGLLPQLRPDDDLRIAHRLDRWTSGCLVLAKGIDGARWLDAQFRARTVEKEYVALVEGVVHRDAFAIRRALGPDRRRPGKVMTVRDDQKGARDAHTDVEVVERFPHHTLLRLRPRTGRGHQIRAHLRSVGHPIVGDVDYGSAGPLRLSALKPGYKSRTGAVERPLLERMFLHAERIRVPAPDDGEPLQAHAPLPSDLELVVEKLRHFALRARRPGGRTR